MCFTYCNKKRRRCLTLLAQNTWYVISKSGTNFADIELLLLNNEKDGGWEGERERDRDWQSSVKRHLVTINNLWDAR